MQIRINQIKSTFANTITQKGYRKTVTILALVLTISIIASSLLLANAQETYVQNPANQLNLLQGNGQLQYNQPYSTSSASAYASARAKWGDPLNEAYYCGYPAFGQGGARTCFIEGPAPDRPDVQWTTADLLMGYTGNTYSYPTIASWSAVPIGMDGQLIGSATIRLPNGTTLSTCVTSVNPSTGALNWYTPRPSGYAAISSDFVGPHINKIDETHFLINGDQMWRTDGTPLWTDPDMNYGDDYNTLNVAEAPVYKACGATGTAPGTRASVIRCYNLSDPETDMGRGNRSLWNYTCTESENPGMCWDMDNDLIIRGSYCTYAVFALNGTTGEKVWETFLPTDTGYAGCYANGRVYVGCLSVAETCLNSTTGEIIWRNTDGYANRAFNVWQVGYAYGRVYYHDLGSGRTGATKCYDALTGQKLWASTSLFSIAYYVFKIADGKVYGNQADGSTTTGRQPDPRAFCCWDAFTGEIIWKFRQNINCPVIAYGSLYFVQGGVLICISTAYPPQGWTMWRGNAEFPGITLDDAPRDFSMGPVWTYQTGGAIMGSPVVDDGKVYIGSADQKIYCFDAYNGDKIWEFMTNQPLNVEWGSTCAVYGGVVITGGDDGFVYGLNKETGAKLWSVDVGPYINAKDGLGQHNIRSSPVIYEGYAYVGSVNGEVYCINPLSGAVMWHVYAGNPSGTVVDPMLGSAAFDKQGYVYFISFTGRMSKINANPDPAQGGGVIVWNEAVPIAVSGGFSFSDNAYTPDVSFDGTEIYYGAVRNQIMIINATDGNEILPRVPIQPHVLAENSHGSLILVPGNLLSAVNQTLSSPTLPNGTIYSGYPIEYVNTTAANPLVGGPQQNGYNNYKSQYTFTSGVDKIIGQAGPTIFCATMEEVNTTATRSSIGESGGGSVQVRLAQKGDNIWSDWGGWEVWSSPIMASFGDNAIIFYGSESYAVHCINASNGVPLTWWTTNGPMGASQAVYDGKLYAASAEGKMYCFEEHDFTQTTTTASVDNTSPNAGQEINVTVKLTSVPTINVYEELGQAAPIPSIPSQAVIVTFIKPDGTTVVDVPATTDEYGNAVVQYTPDVGGDWQVVAAYNGIMGPRITYAKSASDVLTLNVGGSTATETPSSSETPAGTTPTPVTTATPTVAPTSSSSGGADNTLLYAGIAVVVIVVIVLAALVLMRRKK